VTVTTFLTGYGSGGSGSTVGVKDCRGRVLAGRDDLGGTAANRLTATTMSPNGNTLNAKPTTESQTHTMATIELPPYTPAGTNGTSSVPLTYAAGTGYTTTGATTAMNNLAAGTGLGNDRTLTAAAQIFTGTAQGGTSTPFGVVQPTVVSDCIVAVLP
jgi:hypothetical protein